MKIKIFAIVNQLFTNTYDTLYLEAIKDPEIEWTFVLIPFDYLTTHYSITDLQKMMDEKRYPYIVGYDASSKTYLDLKGLSPDIIFIQTPYDNAYASKLYKSSYLSSFAAVVTVSYGCSMIEYSGEYYKNWVYKVQNYQNLWKSFNETIENTKILNEYYPGIAVTAGYVKCEKYMRNCKECPVKQKRNKFTIVWKPRWLGTIGESNFLKYIYFFQYYSRKHPEIEFIFLRHPNLEGFLLQRSIMCKEEFDNIITYFNEQPNTEVIDTDDFLDEVMNADLYIGDYSSTFVEYALTAKPYIYTPTAVKLNKIGKEIYSAAYVAQNIEEMIKHIDTIIGGKDSKFQERQKVKSFLLKGVPADGRYGKAILKYIKENISDAKRLKPKSTEKLLPDRKIKNLKNKFRYKIWKHLNKKLRQEGII